MQITIDTTTPLSESDRGVLAALLGAANITALASALSEVGPATQAVARAEGVGVKLQREAAEREAAAKEVTIEEPAPQPAEKPRRTRKPKPAPEPVQEPEEVPDARPVDDEAPATPAPEAADAPGPDAPTRDEAITRATALMAEGKGAAVKAALANAGVRRVRELDGDEQITEFLDALKEA